MVSDKNGLQRFILSMKDSLLTNSKPIPIKPHQRYELSIPVARNKCDVPCAYVAVIILNQLGREIQRFKCWINESGNARNCKIIFNSPADGRTAVIGYRINIETPVKDYVDIALPEINSLKLAQVDKRSLPSALVIFGEPQAGKTFTASILQRLLPSKLIIFDVIISFIAKYARLYFENRIQETDFRKFFPQGMLESETDLSSFKSDIHVILSDNRELFRDVYEKLIKTKKSNMDYRPGIDSRSDLVNFGLIGNSLESFAFPIMEAVMKHIVKATNFFIIEGYYFNKHKAYRKALEESCDRITNIECIHDRTNNSRYCILNDEILISLTRFEDITNVRKPVSKYQSFSESEIGDSPSHAKLKLLGIPEDLRGKTVLDIGCNEGFYCFECEKRGARVIGIEKNKIWYSLALERRNEFSSFVNFINRDWNDIEKLNYKFDLILFLSGFHYLRNEQQEILSKIYEKMNTGGLLILELGLTHEKTGEFHIQEVKRPVGDICQYPNKFTIEKLLKLAGFDRIIFFGEGFKISGDPVPRFVIHATKSIS